MYACVNVDMYECIKVYIHLFTCLFMSVFVHRIIPMVCHFPCECDTTCKGITYNILTYIYKFRMKTRLFLSNGTRCMHIYIKYDLVCESTNRT